MLITYMVFDVINTLKQSRILGRARCATAQGPKFWVL